jgi:hypothetical protein
MKTPVSYIVRQLLNIPTAIYAILLISLVIIFLSNHYLITNDNSTATTIGNIIINVSYSMIASVIFYIVAFYIPTAVQSFGIRKHIVLKAKSMIGQCKAVHLELARVVKRGLNNDYLSEDDIVNSFNVINPQSNAPLLMGAIGDYANWLQWLKYHTDRSKMAFDELMRVAQYIDPALLEEMTIIHDSPHFKFVNLTATMAVPSNKTLGAWSSTFIGYTDSVKKFESIVADYEIRNGLE